MNIDLTYEKILSDLQKGGRALVKLPSENIQSLRSLLEEEAKNPDQKKLEKLLCIIEHSWHSDESFETGLIELMNLNLPDHLMVFTLNCARKHIIQARFKKGHRLEYNFLEALKKNLHSDSPEIVEWTLRTIEECGNQGIYFLREFDKIKPAPWKWFNPHQRAVREIIALLERRWSQFEKPGRS